MQVIVPNSIPLSNNLATYRTAYQSAGCSAVMMAMVRYLLHCMRQTKDMDLSDGGKELQLHCMHQTKDWMMYLELDLSLREAAEGGNYNKIQASTVQYM